MSEFKKFQNEFVKAVVDNNPSDELLRDVIPGGAYKVSSQPLELHRAGYIARLTEALGETFESIWWFLGDEAFFQVCVQYIKEHPSDVVNLSDYGEAFHESLANNLMTEEMSFLSALARFEWHFKEVFHLPDHAPFDMATFVSHEAIFSANIKFGPSVRLVSSDYQAYELWKLRNENQDEVGEIPIDPKPSHYLFYKNSGQIYVMSLDSDEFLIFQALMKDELVGDGLSNLETRHSLNPEKVSLVFQKIFSQGLVSHLEGLEETEIR